MHYRVRLFKPLCGLTRRCTSSNIETRRIAIVGSGPSGFYSAKYLLEQNKDISVDMFEKLPTPYGLVRFGVAPDHPEVKTVETTFREVASSSRFRFFGNVVVGNDIISSDVSVFDMLKEYSGVILAHGATSDNDLNIPGESLQGIHSARHFVNWYNGHPEVPRSDDCTFNMTGIQDVVIVGQGNVALDCARILTRSVSELSETDITLQALKVLEGSSVKRVTVVGRRGHVQSAFTIKEFRELTKLEGVAVRVQESDIRAGLTDATKAELDNNRPKKRIVELIQSVAAATTAAASTGKESASKTIDVTFLATPLKFVADSERSSGDGNSGRVSGLWVAKNKLEGEPHRQRAVPLGEPPQLIPCQLVLKSVGYKCVPLSPALPFDPRTHSMPHVYGRVVVLDSDSTNSGLYDTVVIRQENRLSKDATETSNGEEGSDNSISGSSAHSSYTAVKGLYVTGWLKRGPSGIIGSNIGDAKETVGSVLADLRTGVTDSSTAGSSRGDPTERLLGVSGGVRSRVVDWEGYLSIDREEARRGAASDPPRPRVKITDRQEMLRIAHDVDRDV